MRVVTTNNEYGSRGSSFRKNVRFLGGIDRPRGSSVYGWSNLPLAETLSGLLEDNGCLEERKAKGCSGRAPTRSPLRRETSLQDLRRRCCSRATGIRSDMCHPATSNFHAVPAATATTLSMNLTNNDKSPESLLVVVGKHSGRSMVRTSAGLVSSRIVPLGLLYAHVTLDDVFRAPELGNLHPVCERRIVGACIVAGTCPSYRVAALEI